MSHTLKMFIAGVIIFLISPMPLVYTYQDPSQMLDCRYGGSSAICAAIEEEAKRTGYEVTIPLLAVSVNKETLNFFSGTPATKDYILTPVTALVVPIAITATVLFLLRKRHTVKVDKKASKKRPMNIWKM